jgi:2-deoxy-D-gluconate 3-dehydrogenase
MRTDGSAEIAGRFDLEDRVILLTGGAGLIGRNHVAALTGAGARVVLADIDGPAGLRVAEEAGNGRCLAVETDITDPASVAGTVGEALRRFGRLDGLVNNAALDPKCDPTNAAGNEAGFEAFPLDLWKKGLDVNLTGAFLCAQAVTPALRRSGRGAIVNVSSIYGMTGPDQRIYLKEGEARPSFVKPPVYSATKAALLGLTRYLAAYFAGTGIRVNALTLGGVYNGHDGEFVRRYTARVPLGRMAAADEYSAGLVFLLSDASSYMTGANLVLDGGWTAW